MTEITTAKKPRRSVAYEEQNRICG